MPRSPTGNGLGSFPSRRRHEPLVARANEATARRLGLTLDQLLEVAATLSVFAPHADGSPTYRWRDLLQATGQLPDPKQTASHRGGLAIRRRAQAAKGGSDGP